MFKCALATTDRLAFLNMVFEADYDVLYKLLR